MKTELVLLAWSAALCAFLAVPYTVGLILERGLPALAGNRENFAPPTGWKGRSLRAHRNMVENLVPFAALVLVVVAMGRTSPTTALAAQLFFWSRLLHAVVYTAGIAWVRTLAYAGGVVAMALLFLAAIGGA